jgi:hypothetical protein
VRLDLHIDRSIFNGINNDRSISKKSLRQFSFTLNHNPLMPFPKGASHFCNPHPKSLSQSGRGTFNPAPLLLFWERGLGDEGKLAELGCAPFQSSCGSKATPC